MIDRNHAELDLRKFNLKKWRKRLNLLHRCIYTIEQPPETSKDTLSLRIFVIHTTCLDHKVSNIVNCAAGFQSISVITKHQTS